MYKRWHVVLLGLALAACFAGGAALRGGDSGVRPAQASQSSSSESRRWEGARWEYCALSKASYVGSSRGGIYWISYFRETGVHVVEVEESASDKNGMTKAIARLGEEGWEMVGQGSLDVRAGTAVNALYFKRPKS